MDNIILTAVILTGCVGLIAAAILTVVSKLMYVKVDPKIEQLREALPGANCGACGYSGCDGYAVALAKGEAEPDLCPPGGTQTYQKLSEILGQNAGEGPEKKSAVVLCIADAQERSDKLDYAGIDTCFAAEQLYGGASACSFGCLGYGDCTHVCPKSAICVSSGIARIDSRICNGCGLCAAICPRNVITVKKDKTDAVVLCNNTEKGAVVRKKCTKGCIACSKCVRECPCKAITITDNLAVIDSEKCDGCGHCKEICMTKCIVNRVLN